MKKIPLVIATGNAHKAKEIAAILPEWCEVHTLKEYPDAPEAAETGRTFAENAKQKAECLSAYLPEALVIADDSGLCVDALNGYPGVISARYAGEHGDDMANNRKLLRELAAMPSEKPHTARFVCVISLAQGGKEIGSFPGVVEGSITLNPRGTNGFGYDPLFIPTGYKVTTAEMRPQDKDAISHRGLALAGLTAFLASMEA